MTQLFDIGRSALSTYQAALTTVSRNVANANAPGYARQSVNIGQLAGGSGVDVVSLTRDADNSALSAAREATAQRAQIEVRATTLSRLDTQVSDPATNLATPLQDLQQSLSALTIQPTDIPTRQSVLAALEQFSSRVAGLDATFAAEEQDNIRSLQTQVQLAQDQLDQLAVVQGQLDTGGALDAGRATLLDQRDVLLQDLSQTLGIEAQVGRNDSLQLGLANGQPLLQAGQPVDFGLARDESGQLQLTVDGVVQPPRVVGGEIRGYLDLLQNDLPAARDSLGQLAAGVAITLNDFQAAGVGLDGNPGPALFSVPEAVVTDGAANTGTAVFSASIDDVSQIPAQRFELSFDAGSYSARDADGNALTVSGTGSIADPLLVSGIALSLAGTPANGDRFVIQPAAASSIESLNVDAQDLSVAAAGSPANSGDNTNLLALQQNISGPLLNGGQDDVGTATNLWIARTGQSAASANLSLDSSRAAENFALDRRDSIQGVNLDEEAADLLRYEQAYQAAAQVIATAGSLFDTILSAVRR
nr:hypothetical protein [Oceanococcus sp. HetDA_MAG_MS8]